MWCVSVKQICAKVAEQSYLKDAMVLNHALWKHFYLKICSFRIDWSNIDRINSGNNLLRLYDCRFNPSVRLQINRLLYD